MPNMLHASVKQLSEKIKGFGKKPTSRFAFFLGAGASRQSGIITASEMIHFFKERIIALECPQELMSMTGLYCARHSRFMWARHSRFMWARPDRRM